MNLEKLDKANKLLNEIGGLKEDIKIWEEIEFFDNVDFRDKNGKNLKGGQKIWLCGEFLFIKEMHLSKLKKELENLEHQFKIL